jgi:ABC-type branched-subunit amino acid transport system substrate-binding protein
VDLTPDPVKIGMLFDFPQVDDSFTRSVALGVEEATGGGRFDRGIDFVEEAVRGLPFGSEHDVQRGFAALDDAGVLLVVGPSISDNCLIARDCATAAELPAINWSGGERTRGPWMFHYQVGSLEEEPPLLATRLVERNLRRVAVLYDHSPVGRGYLEHFESACARLDVEITSATALSPVAGDTAGAVSRARSGDPDALVYFGLGAVSYAVATAKQDAGWDVPVFANSALLFGYVRRDWRDAWAGWEYVDVVDDGNPVRQQLAARDERADSGPITCAGYDIGRLVGEALARADHLTRAGVAEALRRVKRLPAATGRPGTLMGFGTYDHAALKGEFLVLREWKDGRTVQVAR